MWYQSAALKRIDFQGCIYLDPLQIHFSEVGAQTLNWWAQSCSHWAPPDSSHSSCFLSRPNRTLRTGYELGHSSCWCWELKLCHRRHGGRKKPHQSGSSSMLQQPQGPAQPSLDFSHTTILHVSPPCHCSWGWRKSNVVLTLVNAVRSMRPAPLSVCVVSTQMLKDFINSWMNLWAQTRLELLRLYEAEMFHREQETG